MPERKFASTWDAGRILATTLIATPCPDLQLSRGTTWTYQAKVSWTVAGSATVRDTTLIWRTSVLSTRTRAETVVATVVNWPTALAWWDPSKLADTSVIICRENRVWQVGSEGGNIAALADSLDSGARVPTDDDLLFQFPLVIGTLYGRDPKAREDTFYAWFVESATTVSNDSVFTITYRTLPDHQIISFTKNIGITGYTYVHHGTIATAAATLTAFSLPKRN